MNKKTICIAVGFFLVSCASVKHMEHMDTEERANVTFGGLAVDGSYMVSVVGYGLSYDAVIEDAKKKAVSTVLFEGLKSSKNGMASTKPMVPDTTAKKHHSFFSDFFTNGSYQRFVTLTPGSSPFLIKSGKINKSTVAITVHKDALRKELEAKQIIPSLSTVF